MKRALALLMIAASAAVGTAACRQYLPSNRYLQLRQAPAASRSTADARGKFVHAGHAKALAAAGVTCIDCHRFDVLVETGNDAMAREISRRSLHPSSAPCHYCHRPAEPAVTAAPQACTTCHENLEPLRPADHEVAWLKVHASMARAGTQQCENCHRQSFCIDCHARRDPIKTVVHERNFRFFHSVQARANPMQCGRCHRADFCINCHQQGGG